MDNFVPGLELNKGFYEDVVKEIIENAYPELVYSAGLIGFGSDVMGYDTFVSMDHMWGPRLYIFVSKADNDLYGREIEKLLSKELPYKYNEFSTNYSNPDIEGVSSMEFIQEGEIRHLIWVTDAEGFVSRTIGSNWKGELNNAQWLGACDQSLIELVSGAIYHDGLGTLETMRTYFEFYPEDIVRLKLASLWVAISQEVAFIGRNRDIEDLLSVKMISARLVNTLMRMCFYLEGKYVPYSKWFGHGFRELKCSTDMSELFEEILTCNDMLTIENLLAEVYVIILELHNESGFTDSISVKPSDYHGRPYKVLFADSIIEALISGIEDEKLKKYKLDDLALLLTSNGLDINNGLKWLKELY